MKTVIVPVDFSETSLNAAKYATQLLTGHYGVTMVLFSFCETEKEVPEAVQNLDKLRTLLRETGIVKTEILAVSGPNFINELDRMAREVGADLVIMGITGRSPIGQSLIGSNTLKMVEKKTCPVLIVPVAAVYKETRQVMLTSDFENIEYASAAAQIKNVLNRLRPHLHIMNTNEEHYVAITDEYRIKKEQFSAIFGEFHPEFHFLALNDVHDAIYQFANDKSIDLIIIVHREQSLVSRLFGKSNTKKLAYYSTIPVLAVHE
ncbi:MAG TPA: universal stress protein [Chitinophagaceae bacterium]|nr:universal stress protein [Chitinophagaceae bacterium]